MADVGRPTVMTQDTLNKLEEVFALGGTDKEACFYAGISHQTLYDYQKDHPEFVERKEALKETPVLKARKVVIENLNDPKNSQWYLERKRKDEFANKQEVEQSGDIVIRMVNYGDRTTEQIQSAPVPNPPDEGKG